MKNLFNIIFLLSLASCGKYDGGEPTLAQEIAGEWVNAEHPTRHYIFGGGYATTWDYNFSTVINAKWYKTEQTGERDLMLVEINKNDTLYWRFSELNGDAVTIADATNYPAVFFNIERE